MSDENSFIDVWLILPDGTELAYGPVPGGFAPNVGEVVTFQRSDPNAVLVPDEAGIEGPRWLVADREWAIRLRGGLLPSHVVFLTLRLVEVPAELFLGEPIPQPPSGETTQEQGEEVDA